MDLLNEKTVFKVSHDNRLYCWLPNKQCYYAEDGAWRRSADDEDLAFGEKISLAEAMNNFPEYFPPPTRPFEDLGERNLIVT